MMKTEIGKELETNNMTERLFQIYTLTDPRDRKVRYVGCTVNPKARLTTHLNIQANTVNKKELWLLELKALGYKPELDVVFTTTDFTEAANAEVKYFELYDNGELLCNNPSRSLYPNKWIEKTNNIMEEVVEKANELSVALNKFSMATLEALVELEGKSRDEILDIIIEAYSDRYHKHMRKIKKIRKKVNIIELPLNSSLSNLINKAVDL